MKCRTYTAAQMKDIIDRLYMAWLDTPSLKLGELMVDATYPYMVHYSDEEFISAIEKYAEDFMNRGG